jgi:outer membrane receptor protein involved in Fe transport
LSSPNGGAEYRARNWASNLRISLDVQNILNGYQEVTVLAATRRRGLTRDEIDPLGRTIRLNIRKQF